MANEAEDDVATPPGSPAMGSGPPIPWVPARRIAYANDLDAPTSLIAVTAATNRAKSDKDPAQWQPSNDPAWCDYTAAWIATKQRWGLTADAAEVTALCNMIAARGC